MYTTETPSYMIDITPYRLSGHFKIWMYVLNLLLSMHADSVSYSIHMLQIQEHTVLCCMNSMFSAENYKKEDLVYLGRPCPQCSPTATLLVCLLWPVCSPVWFLKYISIYGLCTTKDPVRYYLNLSLHWTKHWTYSLLLLPDFIHQPSCLLKQETIFWSKF